MSWTIKGLGTKQRLRCPVSPYNETVIAEKKTVKKKNKLKKKKLTSGNGAGCYAS